MYMPVIMNPQLYEIAKHIADKTYSKPSAYKSGFIVKTYKAMGGTYKDDNNEKKLKRWINEKWIDISNQSYPVYRPTKKINKNTPKLVSEIDPKHLLRQIYLKQLLQGRYNLPAF